MTLLRPLALIGIVILALLMGLSVLGPGMEQSVSRALPRVSEHAATKHAESADVQARYNAKMCDSLLVYYSSVRGTLLFLCEIPLMNPPSYGGLLYRITENGVFLGSDSYLVSVFIDTQHYWNGVLARDGYQLWAGYISLHSMVRQQFPSLYW